MIPTATPIATMPVVLMLPLPVEFDFSTPLGLVLLVSESFDGGIGLLTGDGEETNARGGGAVGGGGDDFGRELDGRV